MKHRRLVNLHPQPGLCECGCGGAPSLTLYTNRKTGVPKGTPLRFVRHHQFKNRLTKFYPCVQVAGKPTREHRARAERALGKPLPPGAIVHHADGSKVANAPLVICQDQAYHRLLHTRMRVVRAGGNPNTENVCKRCQQVLPKEVFTEGRNSCKPCERLRQHRPGAFFRKPRWQPRSL